MGEGRLWERLRIYSGKLFIAIKSTIRVTAGNRVIDRCFFIRVIDALYVS